MDFRTAHTDVILRWEDSQLDILRHNYPAWDISIEREFPNLTYWNARLEGERSFRIVAECPERLVQWIASCN